MKQGFAVAVLVVVIAVLGAAFAVGTDPCILDMWHGDYATCYAAVRAPR